MEKIGKISVLNILIVFFFSFFICESSAWSQSVTVTATVDRNEMEIGDTFTFTISITSEDTVDFDQPKLPDFSQFDVINQWSGQEMRGTFSNGQVQTIRSQTINYNLAPRAEGNYTIGAAEVTVGSQVFRTNPITIQVLGRGAVPNQGNRRGRGQQRGQQPTMPGMPSDEDLQQQEEDLFSQLLRRRQKIIDQRVDPNEAFFIQAVVDKKTVYEGEQVTASWYLVTRSQIADIDTLKYPSLSGFWKEDIELATRLNFQPEIINGIPYQKALLASYALFPIKPGKYYIDEYRAKCRVMALSTLGIPQEGFITKESDKIEIQVLPRPVDGKPADFSGGVGNFEVTAKTDAQGYKTNSPFTLRVRVEGRGNAKFVELPKIEWPAGFEFYDTKSNMKFFTNGQSYKEFEVLLIPRQAGDYQLPAVSFSFFDPSQKRYYTKSTQAIPIHVDLGEGTETIPSAPLETTQARQAPKKVLPNPVLTAESPTKLNTAQTVGIFGGIYLLILMSLGGYAWKQLGTTEKREDMRRMIKRRLSVVDNLISDGKWRQVGVETTNTIYAVLGDLSGMGGASEEVIKLIEKAPPSFRREVAPKLQEALKRLEEIAFAPENVVGSAKDPKELKKLIATVESLLAEATKYDFKSISGEEK